MNLGTAQVARNKLQKFFLALNTEKKRFKTKD